MLPEASGKSSNAERILLLPTQERLHEIRDLTGGWNWKAGPDPCTSAWILTPLIKRLHRRAAVVTRGLWHIAHCRAPVTHDTVYRLHDCFQIKTTAIRAAEELHPRRPARASALFSRSSHVLFKYFSLSDGVIMPRNRTPLTRLL